MPISPRRIDAKLGLSIPEAPQVTATASSSYPIFLLPAAGVLFLLLGLGPNFQLAFVASAVLVVGGFLLWRPGEAPILFYIFIYQWVQASIGVFYGNLRDLEIELLTDNIGQHTYATQLVMAGLVCLAGGMRYGAGRADGTHAQLARRMIAAQPPQRWLRLFLVTWLVATAMQSMAYVTPHLSQLLLGIAGLKWSAFILLTYNTFALSNGRKGLWLVVFLAEFMMSLGGYFSTFKEVFIYTLIALAAANVRISLRMAAIGTVIVSCMIYFVLIWTAIKPEYRAFVSGGEAAQIITVDYPTRIAKLADISLNLSSHDFAKAADSLVKRLMYVEYFGLVLDIVPRIIPHEYGAIWLDAITRPLMPRLLFPDKPVIDDSALTNKYTLLGVAGAESGTSISLGYMCESYVDFGALGMMPAIFLLGLVLGRLYRWLMYGSGTRGALGMSLATIALMGATYLESSTPKIVGGVFASVLACWLAAKFVIPRFAPWLVLAPADREVQRPAARPRLHAPRMNASGQPR